MQIGILSAQFTVYAIDLRGHGASADGPAWSTSVPKQAAVLHLEGGAHAEPRITQEQVHARMEGFPIPVTDIIEILHQLDLEQPLCFGHSLGGSVALVAELFRPGLWKAVCAFEPPVTATDQQVCKPTWHMFHSVSRSHVTLCMPLLGGASG